MSNINRYPKQLIIVRNDLRSKLRAGKLAAQVAHASLASFLAPIPDHGRNRYEINDGVISASLTEAGVNWMSNSFTKVILRADDKSHVEELQNKAIDARIPSFLITDEGRTVFNEPTITCLGVGPWWNDELDEIFGNLKLY